VQSEPNLQKSAKNESVLLGQTAPFGFQKNAFFEKDWQIASKTDVFNESSGIMSI
jgi:hypothetical protein